MKRRGFTLLEVMISLAILAVALVALSDLNGGAVQMHYYARRATQATLLLRGKMLDVEDQLQKDGPSDFDDEKHGTFEDDGAPDYAWRAEILKPDVQLDEGALLGMLGLDATKQGGSGGPAPGPAGPAAAGGGLASMAGLGMRGAFGAMAGAGGALSGILQGQARTFIEKLKKSVREIRVTVTWKDGSSQRRLSAVQQVVILPDMVGKVEGPTLAAPVQPGVPGATPLGPPIPIGQPRIGRGGTAK